jgi:hypothetical protein
MQNSPSRAEVQESAAPVTYVTLTAEHLPQVHDLLHHSFWSGIDSSYLSLKDGCLSDEIPYLSQSATRCSMFPRKRQSWRCISVLWSDALSSARRSKLTLPISRSALAGRMRRLQRKHAFLYSRGHRCENSLQCHALSPHQSQSEQRHHSPCVYK